MGDLQNKDKSILNIYNLITNKLGIDYFEQIDFWEGDNYAIGLKKGSKLIYISSWKYRHLEDNEMMYYSEFEIINPTSLETKEKHKTFERIPKNELLLELASFLNYE